VHTELLINSKLAIFVFNVSIHFLLAHHRGPKNICMQAALEPSTKQTKKPVIKIFKKKWRKGIKTELHEVKQKLMDTEKMRENARKCTPLTVKSTINENNMFIVNSYAQMSKL
jgi:hypothetical protein